MKGIRSIIQEAVRKAHFNDRVRQRFDPVNIEPNFDFSIIEPHINFIEEVEFDGEFNVGIRIFMTKQVYTAKVPDKDQVSKGNALWVIVRGNELETIMFNSGQAPQNTQYQVDINRLKRMAEQKNYLLGRGDFEAQKQGSGGRRKAPALDLPMIDIDGKKWFVDSAKKRIIYSKNTNNIIAFDAILDMEDENKALKIIDAISTAA